MGSDSIPLWIIFIICVIGGAFFAATESSFSAVNKIKIKSMADDGNKSAKGVMCVLSKFEKALTTLLIGNNVTKIAAASIFTILCTDIFREGFNKGDDFLDSFAFSMICSVLSTVIIFLFSEMIPKSMANDRSESVSLFFQGTLRFLMKILSPISALFCLISHKTSEMFSSKEAEPSITEDELCGRKATKIPKGRGVTYFDTAVAAEHLKCPAYIISGLGDNTCNGSTQMALFNSIKSPKYIEFYQNKVHSFTIPWDKNMYALGDLTLADEFKEHTSRYYEYD